MDKFEKKLKHAPVFVALLVFAVAVTAFIFINGQVNKKNEKAKNIALQTQNESTDKKKIRSLGGFLEDAEEQVGELEKHFVYRRDIVPFLQFVENLGEQVNLASKVSSVKEGTEGKDLFVSADIRGSFESTYKFLKLLENAPYKIEIISFNMGEESGEEGAIWKGSVEMHVISFLP